MTQNSGGCQQNEGLARVAEINRQFQRIYWVLIFGLFWILLDFGRLTK